ncbi:MAG: hypothetical protein JWR33_2143, partial [Naasia sp.]|uniref:hypothetical protein n=1 Tax=Naasia sp. TaxID=2546198 RepID=UPI0026128A27
PLVHSIVAANLVATVRTRIWAVTRYSSRRGQDELKANIRLALPAPDEVLPDNEVPVAPHAVIPMGRSVQVTGEADHYPTLARYIGARALIATLHPIEVTKAKATTTIVEVRLGDERVGQLTPATSASVMPLIAEAEAQGLVTACWAKIQGSRLAAEVTLHVAKAEQVPDSWPSRADTIPTIRSMQPVPRAYVPSDPIQPPPVQPGLSVIWWVLGLVGALLLGLVPFVGLVLTVLAIAGLCWLHIHLRRQPPSGSKLGPS